MTAADVASSQQRLQAALPVQRPANPAAAAAVVGVPADAIRQTALLGRVSGTVVWGMSFVPWGLGWLVMSAYYLLCCFVGAVFGSQCYVVIQAAEHDQAYLARVLQFWSLGCAFEMATGVALCVLRPWAWDSVARLAALAGVLALTQSILQRLERGAKACADLQEKCRDHLGRKLDVVSCVCFGQGIVLAVDVMLPALCILLSALVHATVGAWVVCAAVHGKLPLSLP